MRGKHANAAANRRDRDELVSRAEIAERRADKADAELAQLRTRTDALIAGLRTENAQLAKERDAGASPVLTQAEERIRTLMAEVEVTRKAHDGLRQTWKRHNTKMMAILKHLGMTDTEAMEAVHEALAEDGSTGRTLQYSRAQRDLGTEGAMAVQRARGQRSGEDPLAEYRVIVP